MNNFDKSSTGIDIEVSVYADGFISQTDWSDNFKEVVGGNGGTTGIYFYTDWGQNEALEEGELKAVDSKNTLKKSLLDWALNEDDWNYYTKTDLRAMCKDELIELFEDYLAYMDLEEANDYASEQNVTLILDSYEIISTRGYSQGDYAEVVISNELADDAATQEAINHLFWDAPISYQISVDDDEDIGYVVDENVDCLYDYDADEVMEILTKHFKDHKDKDYILETIKEMLPEYPTYS